MNGVAIGPDTKKNIDALKKADWLVVGEIYPDETSEFWMSPGITADEQKKIQTTVYRLRVRDLRKRWDLYKLRAVVAVEECGAACTARLQAGSRHRCADILKVRRALQKRCGKSLTRF